MQTAAVIEYPLNVKNSIELALREATDIRSRQSMNNYIKQLLRMWGLRDIRITQTSRTGLTYKLQIRIKKDGELLYDILNCESLSLDGNCPCCGQYFNSNATILYIHPGLHHDKVIFACDCGSFYAYYARKEE